MKIIAIDTGNKQIKTEHMSFVSGITTDANVSLAPADEVFKINGRTYGLTRDRQPYLRDKTIDDRYYNLTLLGIVKELELEEKLSGAEHDREKIYDVHLLVGLPPIHMKDSTLRNRFVAYFKSNDVVKVVFKGKTWNISIKKVSVYAQCFAALMLDYNSFKDEPRAIGIDIGGFTADYLTIRKGRIDANASDSLENGVIILYQRIKKAALARDYIIEEEDIDDVLKGTPNKLDYSIVKIIKTETESFVNDFLSSFREYQIDLRNQYVIFLGGASLILKPYLEKHPLIKRCKFIEDINANAEGYKKLYELSKAKEK